MKNIIRLLTFSLLWSGFAYALTVPEEITQEAMLPNSDTHHPLPLMAVWSTGTQWEAWETRGGLPTQYTPTWQISMIKAGHHLMPNFRMPDRSMLDPSIPYLADTEGVTFWLIYYEAPFKAAAEMKLPLTFVGTQWERWLYDDTRWFGLAPAENPNVLITDPATNQPIPQKTVSAFGPTLPWYEVGRDWTSVENKVKSRSMISFLQEWYPEPPLVLFVSNNEGSRSLVSERAAEGIASRIVENDKHYLDIHGVGQSDVFKREAMGKGWAERYRLMQKGMRDGLTNSTWINNARFIGFLTFGPTEVGRWAGWVDYSLPIPGRIDPSPLTWDGGSPPYYLSVNGLWDFQVRGPQVESMNSVFILKEAYKLKADFWYELSTWSGSDFWPLSLALVPPNAPEQATFNLIATIPNYTPARFGGMTQFGMWVTRPRAVRNFSSSASKLADSQAFFDVQMTAVDKIYRNAALKMFWRNSELVANERPHPYQVDIPIEYQAEKRMFMLTTDLDPALPWVDTTELPVFALARVQGVAPARQWLVYAFSPKLDRSGVKITIPGYRDIVADATIAGSFFLVDETNGSVTSVNAQATTGLQADLGVNKTGNGLVTGIPAGIYCGASCSASYDPNTTVTLTATAANDSVFGSWSGCDSVAGRNCTVSVSASRNVSATFNGLPDLVVSALSGSTNATGGEKTSVNVTTTNTGIASAAASATKIYLSTDLTISPSDIPLVSVNVDNLAIGASSRRTISVSLPSTLVTGVYYLGAIADHAGSITEGNAAGTGESNNPQGGTVMQIRGLPAAPSYLSATVNSRTLITLNWTDNATDESGFRIERSTPGTNSWKSLANVGKNATTYANSQLAADTQYYYRVRAYNSRGDSAYSNVVSATTNR